MRIPPLDQPCLGNFQKGRGHHAVHFCTWPHTSVLTMHSWTKLINSLKLVGLQKPMIPYFGHPSGYSYMAVKLRSIPNDTSAAITQSIFRTPLRELVTNRIKRMIFFWFSSGWQTLNLWGKGFLDSFIDVWLTYKTLHTFNVHDLPSLDISMQPWNHPDSHGARHIQDTPKVSLCLFVLFCGEDT